MLKLSYLGVRVIGCFWLNDKCGRDGEVSFFGGSCNARSRVKLRFAEVIFFSSGKDTQQWVWATGSCSSRFTLIANYAKFLLLRAICSK